MKRHSTPTIDISAEPVAAFSSSVSRRPKDPNAAVWQSLVVDIFLTFVSLLMALIFSSAIGAVVEPTNLERALLIPPQWLIFTVCGFPPLLCLFIDMLSTLSNPDALPFARSKNALNSIYAKRLHMMLLAFYFTAILVALCWSALTMSLASKIFVAAIFAFALYALGQSIPSRRMSFIVSGILFLVVLVMTQAFIVIRLEADSKEASEKVLNELIESPGAEEGQKEGKNKDENEEKSAFDEAAP